MKSFSDLPSFNDLRKLWKQEPVAAPIPDLELTEDSWVERGAEVIGFHLCRLEHWLSASGWLRAWLRLNLLLSIALTIAGMLLLPPVAQVLEQLAHSSHWFAEIFVNLVAVLSGIPPIIITVAMIYLSFITFRWYRRFSQRRGQGGPLSQRREEDYYQ